MRHFQFKDKKIRTRTRRNTRIVTWAVSVFIFFSVISMIWPSMFTGMMHGIARPIWRAKIELVDKSVLSKVGTYFKSKKNLEKENLELEEELTSSKYKLLEMELVKNENKRLRTALGMQQYGEESVFSYVLSRPNQTPYDTLILDAGIRDGVRVGDLVRFDESIVLGEIVGVKERTSQARLFSTNDFRSEIVIGGSLGATAVGNGNGNFLIEIPRDITVKEGMNVRLSNFPRTLIGFIDEIEKKSSDSFQKIYVSSPVNISDIDGVLIVRVGE